jgi:hypothetical protein
LEQTLWWSFPGAAKKKQNKAASGEEKTGTFEMTFTGTLIESLMATVERAEQRTQLDGAFITESMLVDASMIAASIAESSIVEASLVQPWFASVQENTDYDGKFLGVA